MAKEAFGTCLDYSVKYQYSDEHIRHCEEWLAARFPHEFPPTADFLLHPTWRRSAPYRAWPALDRRGLPFAPPG